MFLNDLKVLPVGDDLFRLSDVLKFSYKGELIIVPIGFVTDYATIPKPLDKVIKKDNVKYRRSAVLHDYLYSLNISRSKSDKIFLKAMKSEGTPWRYYIPFWVSVRLFGWIFSE